MKNAMMVLFALLLLQAATAQQSDSAVMASLPADKKEQVNLYLHKAKTNQVAAYCLAGAGGILLLASAIKELTGPASKPNSSSYDGTATFLGLLGLATMAASIPCFIHVHKYRNKARAIMYGERGVSYLPGSASVGIRLIIPLGR